MGVDKMLSYHVSFLKSEDSILMINREQPPLMGVWNGVLGDIKNGEHPDESARQQVFDATGYSVEEVHSKGTITWVNDEGEEKGIYLYLFTLENILSKNKIQKTRDGIMMWKKLDWILHEKNKGIANMVSEYLPTLIAKKGMLTFEQKDGIVKQIPQTSKG